MLTELVVNILESFLWVWFQTQFHTSKKTGIKKMIAMSIAVLGLTANIWLADHFVLYSSYTFLVDFTILFLYSVLCLNGNLIWKAASILLFYIGMFACNFLCITVFSAGFHILPGQLIITGTMLRGVFLFVTKILLLIFSVLLLRIRKYVSLETRGSVLIMVLPVLAIAIASQLMELFAVYYDVEGHWKPLVLLVVLVSAFLAIGVFLLYRTLKEKEHEFESQVLLQQLSYQEDAFQQQKEYIKKCRRIQHDMKHKLVVVEQLLYQNDVEQGEKYLRDYLQSMEDVENMSIEEEVWQTLISLKESHAEKEKIIFSKDIQVCTLKMITDIDLCILLGNLLDNAIEAEKQLAGDREIFFLMHEKMGRLYIEVKNKIEESVLQNNAKLQTTKQEKIMHGLGVEGIKKIVKKYEGDIEFSEKEAWFCISVFI